MSLTFLIILVMTVAITIFVIVASLILVLHKNTSRRLQKEVDRHKKGYSELITKYLMLELPEAGEGEQHTARLKRYEHMLAPLRVRLDRMTALRRQRHRLALKNVLVDFSKDLYGEAADRLVFVSYYLGFVDELIKTLGSSHWWVRAHAARDLGFLGAKRAIAPLTAAVEDVNPEVRSEATQALVVLVGVDALQTVFRVGRNLSTWNMMALSVIVLRFREDAVPYLLEGLEGKDQSIVLFCIEMLAEIGFVSAVEPLRSIAKEYPNIIVRTKAVEALGRLGDSRAVPLLMENTSNSYPQMRISAIGALKRVGSPEALPVLLRRMKEGSLDEKIAAGRALASCGAAGEQELMAMVRSSDQFLSRVAAQVMEDEGRQGAHLR